MSDKSEIHVDDIGTEFRCTMYDDSTIVDISSATTLELIFKKPDNTTFTRTAELYTDGTDGKLTYSSIEGDIDSAGQWNLQVKLILTDGTWYSDIYKFTVYENLT
jgi:hypothetical protein